MANWKTLLSEEMTELTRFGIGSYYEKYKAADPERYESFMAKLRNIFSEIKRYDLMLTGKMKAYSNDRLEISVCVVADEETENNMLCFISILKEFGISGGEDFYYDGPNVVYDFTVFYN